MNDDQLKYYASRVTALKMGRREFIGRATALGLTTTLASGLYTTSARAAGPQTGGTIRVGIQGGASSDSLDPAVAANATATSVSRLWGEPLLELAPMGGLEMKVAESYESSPDAKVWMFKIRSGVTFSNGKTVTAEDVLATMERHSGEDTKSGALGIMRGIANMRTEGDTFIVELEQPNADLPYLLTDYHLIIQPNGGKDDPTAAIGTGPYVLQEVDMGVRFVATKRDDYWGDLGYADTIEYVVINDDTARMAALQSGQVDMVNRVPPRTAALVGRAPNIDVRTTSGPGHYVFIMHCNTSPFDNNDLRLALKYAIDRQEMVDKILRGYGSIGNDMPINASYPLFDETIPQREHSIEKAKEHYAKSGHDGSPIILRVADGAFPGAVDAAALFQQTAQAAGIPLEIKREPNDGYWSEVWNVQPFCASYWGGRPVQDQMYSTAYLSTADWNDTRWKRPEFDAMLNAAKAELDPVKRKEIYSQMGRMLRDEGGLILPMFNDFVSGVSNNLGGWITDPNGGMMNNKAAIKCWVKDA